MRPRTGRAGPAPERRFAGWLAFTLCLIVPELAHGQAASTTERLRELERGQAKTEEELQRTRAELETLRSSSGVQPASPGTGPVASGSPGTSTPEGLDVNKFVSKGDFPGSIKGPSNISFQIGGYVAADVIADFNRIASGDSFATSAIRTGPSGGAPLDWTFSARQSRFFIKTSAPLPEEHTFVTYLEADFFSSTGAFNLRLRHAYGQFEHFLAGQTFSTFVDAAMFPSLLDFQGPSGLAFVRQVLVRYGISFAPGWRLSFAAEAPSAEITAAPGESGSPRSAVPDLVLQLRANPAWGHVQLGAVGRWLGWTPDGASTIHVLGWGLNLSTQLNVARKDVVLVQLFGGLGVARYGNDTGGKGLDALSDGRGSLAALGTLGVVLAYTHFWIDRLSSTVTYSHARMEQNALLPATAYLQANYVAANLLLYPIPRVTVGIEYLWGNFQTQDRAHGYANRVQTSFNFQF